MLRELGISAEPRRLLGASGAELVPFARPDLCCGFGGTFSVRQPEVSLAMADDKLAGADGAAIVTADPGCLMHLRGRAEKVGSPVPVVHLASALARGVR
jgi:L-lactate dehydrogenase complex protein LldE